MIGVYSKEHTMTVQLGGPHLNNKSLFAVKRRLKSLGVAVSYPLSDGLITMHGRRFTFNPQKWSLYEVELDYFESIAKNRAHIICNETLTHPGLINNATALGILQAMLHNKPVVLSHKPTFAKDVDLFLREVIGAQHSFIYVRDLAHQTDDELRQLMNELPESVNYNLSRHEKSLAKSRLKSHFRALLSPTISYRSLLTIGR